MSMLDRLLGSFDSGDVSVVCECRRCGTSVDTATAICPECGETEIARYEV